MDLTRFKAGEADALDAATDLVAPTVWTIARRGFVCDHDGRVAVRGIGNPGEVEALVIEVVATLCQPARRASITGADQFRQLVLTEAKHALLAHAVKVGEEVSVKGAAADDEGLDDLDAIIGGQALSEADPPTDVAQDAAAQAELDATNEWRATLDPRSARLVQLRFGEHATVDAIAADFDCGRAAVRKRERRTRRKLRWALRRTKIREHASDAALDLVLVGDPNACAPPPVTMERVRRGVSTRTFKVEPAPYGQRAMWGVAATALAGGLWALMLVGVLPSYADDRYPEPALSVACNPACTPGSEARLTVQAPNDASFVAFLLREGKTLQPLLADPAGKSLSLPFGARQAAVEVPYPATIPAGVGADAEVVAVFSNEELKSKELTKIAAGRGAQEGALVLTSRLSAAN